MTLAMLAGCSAKGRDLGDWRAHWEQAKAGAEGELDATRVQALRADGKLQDSRRVALLLVGQQPDNADVLFLAARAEADSTHIFLAEEKEQRALAALSSLNYAERAVAAAGGLDRAPVEIGGQLAWSLGTTTHLQPMMKRSAHARKTLDVAQAVLDRDPQQHRALATMALLNLRLQTLPWIANVMARSAPESSLEEAEKTARLAIASHPALEYDLILAKVLVAREKVAEADAHLATALARPNADPTDESAREDIRLYRLSLAEKLKKS